MSQKRKEIISEAAKVIHSKGYQSTKIEDILRIAGIGKGQFYYYFKNKYDLGLAVVDDLIETWEKNMIIGVLQQNGEPLARLRKMFDWIIEFHKQTNRERGCPFGNLAAEMSEHDEQFRQKINQFFQFWIAHLKILLEEMDNKGQIHPEMDMGTLAQSIVVEIEGATLLMKNQKNIKILQDTADLVMYRLAQM